MSEIYSDAVDFEIIEVFDMFKNQHDRMSFQDIYLVVCLHLS